MNPTDLSLSFASPAFLWALLLVPAALLAYVFAQRRRARYAVRFTNLELLASILPRVPAWRRHLPAALSLFAHALLGAGVAQPHALIPVPKDQATVVLVMDTSGSMAARDVAPTRMDAARNAAKTFLD
ncbi:MAG TPA: BatA domain-containing protein, partial [Chloroflexota bacterium]|nr:BatA domain-containing protein [Chloroflexota bacterium]